MKKMYLMTIVMCFVQISLFGMQLTNPSWVRSNKKYSKAVDARTHSLVCKMIKDKNNHNKSVINVPTGKVMRCPNQKKITKPTVCRNSNSHTKKRLDFSVEEQNNGVTFDGNGTISFFDRKQYACEATSHMNEYVKIEQQLRENGHNPQLCNKLMIIKDHLKLLGVMTIRPTSSQVVEEICDMGTVDLYYRWDKEKKENQV